MAVNATAVWRIRTGGSNTNGGGYDPGISGAGTDYSQQDSAQLTLTDIVSANTTTVTSVTGGFTSAMIGNAIWLTGGGATAGPYFITARTDTNTITIDRAAGTIAAGTGRVGGAWANPTTNASSTYMVAGVTIYIRGSGSRVPASVDYTPTAVATLNGTANRPIRIIGENGTPLMGFSGTCYFVCTFTQYENLGFKASAATGTGPIKSTFANHTCTAYNCYFDQNGYDVRLLGTTGEWAGNIIGCEFYSSTAKRSTNSQNAVELYIAYGEDQVVSGCFFHDLVGLALKMDPGNCVFDSVFANNGGVGLYVTNASTSHQCAIIGNTFSANAGAGNIEINAQASLTRTTIINNIIANHGTAGIKYSGAGSSAEATAWADCQVRRNSFYNNSANASGFTLSADNTTGTNPAFVDSTNENYTPSNAALVGTVTVAFPGQALAAPKVAMVNRVYPGAIQPNGVQIISPVTNVFQER